MVDSRQLFHSKGFHGYYMFSFTSWSADILWFHIKLCKHYILCCFCVLSVFVLTAPKLFLRSQTSNEHCVNKMVIVAAVPGVTIKVNIHEKQDLFSLTEFKGSRE